VWLDRERGSFGRGYLVRSGRRYTATPWRSASGSPFHSGREHSSPSASRRRGLPAEREDEDQSPFSGYLYKPPDIRTPYNLKGDPRRLLGLGKAGMSDQMRIGSDIRVTPFKHRSI